MYRVCHLANSHVRPEQVYYIQRKVSVRKSRDCCCAVRAEKWRKDLKLAGVSIDHHHCKGTDSQVVLQRQFQRLIEMLVLYKTDISDAKAQRAYRLQVKERLYRFNFVGPHLWISLIKCIDLPSLPGNIGTTGKGRTT